MGSNDDYCSCEHYFGLSLRHEFPNESYNELLPDDYGAYLQVNILFQLS